MRPEEAETLSNWVRDLQLPPGALCLNIGSSTKAFREIDQPHISERFVTPLEEAGLRFIHCDMKEDPGVDEVGDILDPQFRSSLKRHGAQLLVCSNLLEHLANPGEFARACGDLDADGGYGLFSVPLSYPYHPDPIDTMLRLKPDELAALLPGWTIVRSCELEMGNYWEDLQKVDGGMSRLIRQIARVTFPIYRLKNWRPNASRLRWLFRPYRQSIVLVRKPAAESGASMCR
jgi:hypothetical protein